MSKATIYNFNSDFLDVILKRGQEIYNEGLVTDLTEETNGWSARVIGSQKTPYIVEIKVLKNDNLGKCSCNCPYSHEGNCKHIAAVLYAIKASMSNQKPVASFKTAELDFPLLSNQASLADAQKNPLEYFQQLSEVEQRLLICLSIYLMPVSVEVIARRFNDAGFRVNNERMNNVLCQVILSRLVTAKIAVQHANAYEPVRESALILCLMLKRDKNSDFKQALIPLIKLNELRSLWYNRDFAHILNKAMLGIYSNRDSYFFEGYPAVLNEKKPKFSEALFLQFLLPDDQLETFAPLYSTPILSHLLYYKINLSCFNTTNSDHYLAYIANHLEDFDPANREKLLAISAQMHFLKGNWSAVEKTSSLFLQIEHQLVCWATLNLLKGNVDGAITGFQEAVKIMRKKLGNNKLILSGFWGLMQILAILKKNDLDAFSKTEELIQRNLEQENAYFMAYKSALAILYYLKNDAKKAIALLPITDDLDTFSLFFTFLALHNIDPSYDDQESLVLLRDVFQEEGLHWMKAEISTILADNNPSNFPLSPQDTEAMPSFVPLANLVKRVDPWIMALNALEHISKKSGKNSSEENSQRLIWLVNFEKHQLEAKEQSFGKNGWSSGRTVSINRLIQGNLPCLTTQDKTIVSALSEYYGFENLEYNERIWQALVGHPLIFLMRSPDTAVQFARETPVLLAKPVAGGYTMTFSHEISNAKFKITKETPTRYILIEPTETHRKIQQTFSGKSLFIPNSSADQLKSVIEALSGIVETQSPLLAADVTIPEVPADARIHVHLLPVGDGFHVELFVKPFTTAPPYCRPGEGEALIMSIVNGEKTRTERSLSAEKAAMEAIRSEIPTLKNTRRSRNGNWQLDGTQNCLQLLTELDEPLRAERIVLEWPKGEKLRVKAVLGADQFQMRITEGKNGQWFEIEGGLQLDEEKVLTMQQLIELSMRAQGQFIELSHGKFLALTEDFRKRLRQINGLLTIQKNGVLSLHPLAASAFEVFSDTIKNLEFDQKFKENRARLKAAFDQKFKVPKQFNADLRSYQKEGFQWLHRLAAWGVGACLADDMGLGKTIQALAFLTDRAKLGPALVVAPASVCRNWVAETEKFAPNLRPVLFGEGDRAGAIDQAKKGEIVIVTYDLLARESAHFLKKEWATVILDEAQAIKNRATKRSETAMQLQAGFRLAMSGTPIENHLGELWNLFQFTNPGLLGSLEQFTERFAMPIEKLRDDNRRDQLRRLVQPFILRRKKDEVLKELPDKTEITLRVPLTAEESAFYEALRREAIANLETDTSKDGEKHLKILAEIMRLRRAACHPKLVDEHAAFLESSKLRAFGELVEELLENGHKALVFSQFTGHLGILEDYLKSKKIEYQYLDGSTPLNTRQKRIEKFQSGEGGNLFLISLKAGGTGLNLTAADYVLHMDPWWNPAVEDQATDRAHRIGQEKPVTVYRLVAEGTIEEKILRLHEQKRDLADSLLAGTGASAKLSADELMQLLRER